MRKKKQLYLEFICIQFSLIKWWGCYVLGFLELSVCILEAKKCRKKNLQFQAFSLDELRCALKPPEESGEQARRKTPLFVFSPRFNNGLDPPLHHTRVDFTTEAGEWSHSRWNTASASPSPSIKGTRGCYPVVPPPMSMWRQLRHPFNTYTVQLDIDVHELVVLSSWDR